MLPLVRSHPAPTAVNTSRAGPGSPAATADAASRAIFVADSDSGRYKTCVIRRKNAMDVK